MRRDHMLLNLGLSTPQLGRVRRRSTVPPSAGDGRSAQRMDTAAGRTSASLIGRLVKGRAPRKTVPGIGDTLATTIMLEKSGASRVRGPAPASIPIESLIRRRS